MVFKKIIFQNSLMANETPSRPPPLHGKCHLKFPFWFFAPFPNIYSTYKERPWPFRKWLTSDDKLHSGWQQIGSSSQTSFLKRHPFSGAVTKMPLQFGDLFIGRYFFISPRYITWYEQWNIHVPRKAIIWKYFQKRKDDICGGGWYLHNKQE